MIARVDLRPVSVRRERAAVLRLRWWGAACALSVAVWCAAAIGVRGVQTHGVRGLEERAAVLRERVETCESESARLRRQIGERARLLAAARTVGEHPDWSVLMRLLAGLCGDDAVLTSLDLARERPPAGLEGEQPGTRVERYSLTVSGFGRSPIAVSGLVLRLEETGLFEEVDHVETRRGKLRGQDVFGFEVRCTLVGSRGGVS